MEDDEEIDLREGMQVSNEDGEELGTLAALLVDDEDEEADAEFLLVRTGNDDRLVPFEAILGVGDGALVIDVTRDVLVRYPALKPGQDPTDDDVEKAYDLYDETARYTDDDE